MLKRAGKRCESSCLSMAQTQDLRVLDDGGREGTLRAPRGQLKGRAPHAHAELLSTLHYLPSSSLGIGAGGSQLKGRENRNTKSGIQPHTSTTKPMRESKGLFSRHKRCKSRDQ